MQGAVQDVIAGARPWAVVQSDCLEFLRQLPEGCASLVFGSPPYRLARTYGINFNLADQAWVDWMVQVFTLGQAACNGLVAMVVEGQTKNYRWTAEPVLLMADLHRAGLRLRKPPAFHRVGIPGSGGPDWLRNDYEFIVCTTPKGKLPWSDNTALGHPPKWAPGGEADPWAKRGRGNNLGGRNKDGSKKLGTNGSRDAYGFTEHDGEPSPTERANGKRRKKTRLGRNMANGVPGSTKGSCAGRRVPRGHELNGEILTEDAYLPPVLANPGNVIHCNVGGGAMGHPLAHENEAPFPQTLAEFFVRSFCPPGGLVIDCFSGSGTTGAAAIRWGRRFLGCDVRQSQVDLSCKRISSETPMLLLGEAAS